MEELERQETMGEDQGGSAEPFNEPEPSKPEPQPAGGTPDYDELRRREEELLKRERELLERERSFMDKILSVGQLEQQAQEVGIEISEDELLEAQDDPAKFRELVERIAAEKVKAEYGDLAAMKQELERMKFEKIVDNVLSEVRKEAPIYGAMEKIQKGLSDVMVLVALDLAKLTGTLPPDKPVTPEDVKRSAKEFADYLDKVAREGFPTIYKEKDAGQFVQKLRQNEPLYREVKKLIVEEYLQEREHIGSGASVMMGGTGTVTAKSGEDELLRLAARSREKLNEWADLILKRNRKKGV